MPDQKEPQSNLKFSPRHNFDDDLTISTNLSRDAILISADKALLKAIDFRKAISLGSLFNIAISVFGSTITTLVTSDFHDALSLSKETWSAIYILISCISGLVVIVGIARKLLSPDETSPESFVQRLKGPT